jgi:hypothetical protein
LQSRNGQVKKQKREALKRLKTSKEQTESEEKSLQINLQRIKNFLPLQSQTKREAGSATQKANEKVKSMKFPIQSVRSFDIKRHRDGKAKKFLKKIINKCSIAEAIASVKRNYPKQSFG